LERAHDAAFQIVVLGRDFADFLAVVDARQQLGGLPDLLAALFGLLDGLFALLAVFGLLGALQGLLALEVFLLEGPFAAALALLVLLALLFLALLGVRDVAPSLGFVGARVLLLASVCAGLEDFEESAGVVQAASLSTLAMGKLKRNRTFRLPASASSTASVRFVALCLYLTLQLS
jgi:hypothetical protein